MINLNDMFQAQMLWNNDSTFFYLTGRDVIAIMIGFLSGAILVNIFRMIDALKDERRTK